MPAPRGRVPTSHVRGRGRGNTSAPVKGKGKRRKPDEAGASNPEPGRSNARGGTKKDHTRRKLDQLMIP
jgi:hypothetical protein